MDELNAIAALAALAQSTRLETFRLLVKHEPEGMAAGALAEQLAAPQNTMSSHLAILSRSGLISGTRYGRSIIYRANLKFFQQLNLFLLKDCCGGREDVCMPIIKKLTPCCAQQ